MVRWPLRYQISLPMAAIMLLAIATASGLQAYLAAGSTRALVEERIRSAAGIVAEANFPLTDSVLRQLRGLSRAEFLVIDSQKDVKAASAAELPTAEIRRGGGHDRRDLVLEDPIRIAGEEYFHARVPLRPRPGADASDTLHILYPVAEYRAAWQSAVLPSLGVLLVALPAVVVLAVVTAARISRRTHRLQDQLARIAAGDFRPAPLPSRNDELRDLAAGVNETSRMLAAYEDKVRTSERMQTLARLGGAVAHQIRNAVTGCRVALHFHREDCPQHDDESLRVAWRQLELMEEYVARFLQHSKTHERGGHDRVDLSSVVGDVLPLVAPAARHAGVDLDWRPPSSPALVWADRAELNQLLINLLTNGIEAAAQPAAQNGSPAQVRVTIDCPDAEHVRVVVCDTGSGPGMDVRERIFEPFVSGKPDGVGLGLSVVRGIVEQHGATVHWERIDGWTRFIVDFPPAGETEGLTETLDREGPHARAISRR